ncbi:23S rRNA pseudouridine(1911/1915/1917) synthase RluD [Hydrocarboniclastica marina]|nr:23S rRNA pseudouridine(1911/1915/1917) synthase RluD [Hydrocarboniclastica marina]
MSIPRDHIQLKMQVPAELSEKRLDQAVADLLPEHSRARIQGWIKNEQLRVNGKACKPREKVRMGDSIDIDAIVSGEARWEAQQIELDILYEDEHLIVLNKPAGLVVHPAAGHASGTLVNALLNHAPELDHIPRAGVVHRLDKDTSGVMVVARSLVAHTYLVNQLQARTMGREYAAVVVGAMTGGGVVDAPIGRHPHQRKKMAVVPGGKPAITHYRLIRRYSGHTHVRCKLESGRTHQIRVHMASIRHPVVGDPVYAGRLRVPAGATEKLRATLGGFSRQALHARILTLLHPETGAEVSWEAPLPQDFVELVNALDESEAAKGTL